MSHQVLLYEGETAHDITNRCYKISTTRGRESLVDEIDPGSLLLAVRNQDRAFDPPFTGATPGVFGAMTPGRKVVVKDGAVTVFTGLTHHYRPMWDDDGNANVSIDAFDALGPLATTDLVEHTADVYDRPGERIGKMLDRAEVGYPDGVSFRDLDAGLNPLQGDEVRAETKALDYAQLATRSDLGRFFASRTNVLTYRDRYSNRGVSAAASFGTGGIPVHKVRVRFGDDLHREVAVSREGGVDQVARNQTAIDANPELGVRRLRFGPTITNSDAYSAAFSSFLLDEYSELKPVVSGLVVVLNKLSVSDRASVAGLEINDLADFAFTPNNVGDPVSQTSVVEGIRYDVDTNSRQVTMTFHLTEAVDLSDYFVIGTDLIGGPKVIGF